jgi:dienelactone hydrolase
VYHIGQGERTLVIFSDIFGATSGRHRNVADLFASLHYNVYLPEILQTPYQGEIGPAIMQNIKGQDQAVMTDKFEKLREYL